MTSNFYYGTLSLMPFHYWLENSCKKKLCWDGIFFSCHKCGTSGWCISVGVLSHKHAVSSCPRMSIQCLGSILMRYSAACWPGFCRVNRSGVKNKSLLCDLWNPARPLWQWLWIVNVLLIFCQWSYVFGDLCLWILSNCSPLCCCCLSYKSWPFLMQMPNLPWGSAAKPELNVSQDWISK